MGEKPSFSPEENYAQFKETQRKKQELALKKGQFDASNWLVKLFHKRSFAKEYQQIASKSAQLEKESERMIADAKFHMRQIQQEAQIEEIKRNPQVLKTLEDDYSRLDDSERDRFFNQRIPIAVAFARGYVLRGKDFSSAGLLPSEKTNGHIEFTKPWRPEDFELGRYSGPERQPDQNVVKLDESGKLSTSALRNALLTLFEPTQELIAKDEAAASISPTLWNRELLKIVNSLSELNRFLTYLSPHLVETSINLEEVYEGSRHLPKADLGRMNVLPSRSYQNAALGEFYYVNTVSGIYTLYPLLIEKIKESQESNPDVFSNS